MLRINVVHVQKWRTLDFIGVYYILPLTAHIMSMGQLGESGYDTHIKEGVMSVHESSGRVLAKVECARNRLYVLNVNIA
jgi:hypothetical protein